MPAKAATAFTRRQHSRCDVRQIWPRFAETNAEFEVFTHREWTDFDAPLRFDLIFRYTDLFALDATQRQPRREKASFNVFFPMCPKITTSFVRSPERYALSPVTDAAQRMNRGIALSAIGLQIGPRTLSYANARDGRNGTRLQVPPHVTHPTLRKSTVRHGAIQITNQLLYQLSYVGALAA